MTKYLTVFAIFALSIFSSFTNAAQSTSGNVMTNLTAFDFSFKTLMMEDELPLSQYKGQVLLVVNTASHCGFTPQFEGLEALYKKYKDQGFAVIGVPSEDFGKQEFEKSSDIAQYCKVNYGVSFPMSKKEHVKGSDAHPFYIWAKNELGFGTAPKWNFHKYLVNKEGKLINYFHTTTSPTSKKVMKAIEGALKAQ